MIFCIIVSFPKPPIGEPGIGLTSGVVGLYAKSFNRTSYGKEFRIGVNNLKHRFLTNNTCARSTHTFDRSSTTGTDLEVKGSETSANFAGERGVVQFNERWIEKIQPFGSGGEVVAPIRH